MSMMATIETGDGWAISENMVDDTLHLRIDANRGDYIVRPSYCSLTIPDAAIDALRAIQPRFLPHLRQQRAAVFSERSKKGWQTRRNECKAQQDADIKTLIGFPADAPKSVTMIRGAK